ncbi:hypothetical protein NECAME_06353 [Necator americanus]|uniref:Uncharacterized protein n=1 Tax=Necator americanus TaxID=51031 RepID=W2TWP2_NECAM|nr:hypothetical protein NECAME_06353 [Necator americanus]ETN85486.1 hypothetical protein NECAME_06353 [Necator americanus]
MTEQGKKKNEDKRKQQQNTQGDESDKKFNRVLRRAILQPLSIDRTVKPRICSIAGDYDIQAQRYHLYCHAYHSYHVLA